MPAQQLTATASAATRAKAWNADAASEGGLSALVHCRTRCEAIRLLSLMSTRPSELASPGQVVATEKREPVEPSGEGIAPRPTGSRPC